MSGILSYSTLLLFIKRALRPVHLLSSSRNTITRSFLFYTIYLIHSLLYRSLFCMSPPQPYPSFTLVMSSESALFASFATNDNMRLPAYRTSRSTRFHPYSRPRPSLHQERLMTTVDYCFPKPSEGPVRDLALITPWMFTEDDDKAENRSVASTSSAESILRRQKLKTAAGRLSAVIVTLRRIYRGTSVKQAEQKLQFELLN